MRIPKTYSQENNNIFNNYILFLQINSFGQISKLATLLKPSKGKYYISYFSSHHSTHTGPISELIFTIIQSDPT